MSAFEKATQEAAEEMHAPINNWTDHGLTGCEIDALAEIITKHLAPIKDELDAKDKLLSEAREIIEGHTMEGCDCPACDKAQDLLARVKPTLTKNE